MAFPETMPSTELVLHSVLWSRSTKSDNFKHKTTLDLDGLCNEHLNSQLELLQAWNGLLKKWTENKINSFIKALDLMFL